MRTTTGAGDGGFRASEVRSLSELDAFLAPHEPRSSVALGLAMVNPLGRRTCRAWRVDAASGDPVGAVVCARSSFDRWTASVVLLDPAAAPTMARTIDRSPAWAVSGPGADVQPLLAHIGRLTGTTTMPWMIAEAPMALLAEVDSRTRMATLADLERLVDLYLGYERGLETTRWQMRQWVRQSLARRIFIVAEEAGELIGAVSISMRTSRYLSIDRLTVLPEHRRRGLAWQLVARAQTFANGMGLGGIAAIAPSNPMSAPDHVEAAEGLWLALALRPPTRMPGHNLLRAIYARAGARGARPLEDLSATRSRSSLRPDT